MQNILTIGIIGDFEPERPSHKATNDAIKHSAEYLKLDYKIEWLPTETLERDSEKILDNFNGLWCAPGSPYKSMDGAIKGIKYARENNIPFIGTCGGFQHTALEYAKNKLGLNIYGENEKDPYESNLFISQLSCSLVGETRKIYITKNTQVYNLYNETEVLERYNCNFGLSQEFRKLLSDSGLQISATDETGDVRILELPGNNFYIATLFQPQLSSTPENPHKLINGFLNSIMD
jgi:CTP synthase (UTP-ammonia lyase)